MRLLSQKFTLAKKPILSFIILTRMMILKSQISRQFMKKMALNLDILLIGGNNGKY